MILLQVPENGIFISSDSIATDTPNTDVSLLDLTLSGGWFMIPLLLLSLLGIYVFVSKYLALRKAQGDLTKLMDTVKMHVLNGNIDAARAACAADPSPAAKLIDKGITRLGQPLKNIEVSIENQAKLEVAKLEDGLPVLATVAGAAPMVGFLGTVTGMISAFMAIAQQEGSVSPKLLSAGIYEGLVTTAAGLIIGIPAYVAYNYLVTKVDKIVQKMEYASIEFLDLLQEKRS